MELANQLQLICIDKSISIAVAESCTSGLIASKITSISGSSHYFKGGVIAYQNEIKTNVLGVSQDIIDANTEVSAEVVVQMAKGTLCKFNADYCVATSGYAGPKGGTEINPVGTVFIAVVSKEKSISKQFLFDGRRKDIVNQSVMKSMELLIGEIKNQ